GDDRLAPTWGECGNKPTPVIEVAGPVGRGPGPLAPAGRPGEIAPGQAGRPRGPCPVRPRSAPGSGREVRPVDRPGNRRRPGLRSPLVVRRRRCRPGVGIDFPRLTGRDPRLVRLRVLLAGGRLGEQRPFGERVEPLEHPRQQPHVLRRPGGEQRVELLLAGGPHPVQQLPPLRGEDQAVRPAVEGVGLPADQPQLLQDLHLAADRRLAHAEARGEIARPDRGVPIDGGEQPIGAGLQLRVDLASHPRGERLRPAEEDAELVLDRAERRVVAGVVFRHLLTSFRARPAGDGAPGLRPYRGLIFRLRSGEVWHIGGPPAGPPPDGGARHRPRRSPWATPPEGPRPGRGARHRPRRSPWVTSPWCPGPVPSAEPGRVPFAGREPSAGRAPSAGPMPSAEAGWAVAWAPFPGRKPFVEGAGSRSAVWAMVVRSGTSLIKKIARSATSTAGAENRNRSAMAWPNALCTTVRIGAGSAERSGIEPSMAVAPALTPSAARPSRR